MNAKNTLSQPSNDPLHFARNVVLKGLLLFFIANLAFTFLNPGPFLGRISAYNRLWPGRSRLPYGDNPLRAYNLSLFNLEAMFASHELSTGPKPAGEYRVLLVGDSATWGFLLQPEHTLAAYINAADHALPDGRRLRAYNLGYPVMSLTKDLLILTYAVRYQPDLIVWPLTLESFPYDKQLYPPLLQNNPEAVRELIHSHRLKLDPDSPDLIDFSFWDGTLIGQRRNLADLIRLQLFGIMWAATGIDQDIPPTYTPRMEDLPAEENFHDLQPPHLTQNDLAFDVLAAGIRLAGNTPILLVNEPMFISRGENSHLRYNFFYPRWAYDDYRRLMAEYTRSNDFYYRDLWDTVPPSEFTNSAVHLTPNGTVQLSRHLIQAIAELAGE